MKIKTLQESITAISSENWETYSDNELTDLFCSFGLNDEVLHEMPTHLTDYYGKGIKIWQYPIQFIPFMRWLSNKVVSSYAEIGTRWGGTFIVINEILRRKNKDIKTIACDPIACPEVLNEYKKIRDFVYIQDFSSSNAFKKAIDSGIEMVFIDGDHSYNAVKADFELFKNNKNTKYIIFHDIDSAACPGCVDLWRDLKNDQSIGEMFAFLEFTDQYRDKGVNANYLGIGILTRK